jgi:hypothetical protein
MDDHLNNPLAGTSSDRGYSIYRVMSASADLVNPTMKKVFGVSICLRDPLLA